MILGKRDWVADSGLTALDVFGSEIIGKNQRVCAPL
jgi:hypothetical protein